MTNRLFKNIIGALAFGLFALCASDEAISAETELPNLREAVHVIPEFRFESGDTLSNLKVGYTTFGTAVKDSEGRIANAVLLLHGTTSTGANWLAPSLASALYGTSQPLDASKHFMIAIDSLGLGRSSKPSDGLKGRFPKYTYTDMIRTQHAVVTEALGIKKLKAIVGTSMGGMHTWMWAQRYPDMMERAVAIASQPTAITGRNFLWRKLMIETIRSDPEYNNGDYTSTPKSFSRLMPMFALLVDSATHLQTLMPTRADAEKYFAESSKSSARFDPNDLLYRWDASRDYDPEPKLSSVSVPFLAINFADDELNPPELGVLDKLIKQVPQGTFTLIPADAASIGHQNLTRGALWAPYLSLWLSGTK